MKYDTQIAITASGTSRSVQVCIDYEVHLPDQANDFGERLDVFGAHFFTGGNWMPLPHFWNMLSEEQRETMMRQMSEAWHAAKGLPVLEKVGK